MALQTRKPAHSAGAPATMSIAEAKANFSSLISTVASGQRSVTISRRGVPVAIVTPHPGISRGKLSGSMMGTARELGDIVSPLGINTRPTAS